MPRVTLRKGFTWNKKQQVTAHSLQEFMFSYTEKVMGNMASGYGMSSAAFLAKHARLQNVSMFQMGMK